MSKTINEDVEKLKKRVEELESYPQRIENENGTAIKFVDGTMICTTSSTPGAMSANKMFYGTWNYPLPFVDTPVVTANVRGGVSKGYTVLAGAYPSYCEVQILCINSSGNIDNADRGANCIAIGRWK